MVSHPTGSEPVFILFLILAGTGLLLKSLWRAKWWILGSVLTLGGAFLGIGVLIGRFIAR